VWSCGLDQMDYVLDGAMVFIVQFIVDQYIDSAPRLKKRPRSIAVLIIFNGSHLRQFLLIGTWRIASPLCELRL